MIEDKVYNQETASAKSEKRRQNREQHVRKTYKVNIRDKYASMAKKVENNTFSFFEDDV